ncbi:MAG TPA: glycosyltransferase family 4 protein [Longimicrobiales bacterium]
MSGGTRTRITEGDVLRLIVQRRLGALPRGPLEVHAHDLDLAIGRDVVDLMLRLRRRDWVWTDTHDRVARPAHLATAIGRVVREAVWSTPAGVLRHLGCVRRLESAAAASARARRLERTLFLRSDHAFGLIAGGSVGHLAGVIRGMRRLGRSVQVVSSDVLVDVPIDQDFHLLRPIYGSARNFSELIRLEYNDQLVAALERLWCQLRPDFVYHRYSTFNYVGPALRARYGVPYVCEFNGPLAWVQRHWDDRPLVLERLAERIERLNLSSADLVVVVSRALVDEAVKRGAHPSRILVNPNGVDPDRYRPDIPGDEVRRRYGLGDAIVVGFIGTIGPWHGVEKLIEAAARVASEAGGRNVRFLIIGDGTRMGTVRTMMRNAGIESVVTLTGMIPQHAGPAHLAACDILVSPHVPNPDGSEFFGSPTKLFEYMATGRAIIASRLGQIGEVLEDGATALLVPPGDGAALAAAIGRLVGDPALRARLGAAAREAAVRDYSWDAHSHRIVEALRAHVCGPQRAGEPACRAH